MKKLLVITLSLILSACQNAPVAFSPRPFAFELNQTAPITVNVREIRVADEFKSPLRKPNVEQEFPVSPAIAIKKWANDRLQATPTIHGNSVLEVIITDASVKETALAKTKGLKGVFTDDQDARYDARIAVTFRLFDGEQAMSRANSEVIVTRSRTINEKATVYEREAIYHHMLSENDA